MVILLARNHLNVRGIRSLFSILFLAQQDNLIDFRFPALATYALPKVSRDLTPRHITGEGGLTLDEIQTATAGDEVLSKVVEFVQTQCSPKEQITAGLLPFYHIQDEFHLEGCLVRDCQFLAPIRLHTLILGLAHLDIQASHT